MPDSFDRKAWGAARRGLCTRYASLVFANLLNGGHMKTRVAFTPFLLCFLVGCSGTNKISEATEIYEGFFTQGFEDFAFQPCGSNERWCMVGNNDKATGYLSEQINKIVYAGHEKVFVRLRGELQPEKPEVSTNSCDRNFLLKEVLLVRAIAPGDCSK